MPRRPLAAVPLVALGLVRPAHGAPPNPLGEQVRLGQASSGKDRDPNLVEVEGHPPYHRKPDVASLGSFSVGHAHTGFLVNGVRMPSGDEWTVGVPQHAWGTEETVANLIYCIRQVAAAFPNTPRVILGSLSPEHGGPAPPHKSHRTGRDVDIYLYRLPGFGDRWNKTATAEDLDRARTWALMRAFITETDIDFILLDKKIQALIEDYALSLGEDAHWIEELFHGNGKPYSAVIKHVPGHGAHMHVRFVSAAARERARRSYDRLVQQGRIEPPRRSVEHEVVRGDTLIGIARHYGTKVDAIVANNKLTSALIRIGQKLVITQREDVRGARDRVFVPPRHLPPRSSTSERDKTAHDRTATRR